MIRPRELGSSSVVSGCISNVVNDFKDWVSPVNGARKIEVDASISGPAMNRGALRQSPVNGAPGSRRSLVAAADGYELVAIDGDDQLAAVFERGGHVALVVLHVESRPFE